MLPLGFSRRGHGTEKTGARSARRVPLAGAFLAERVIERWTSSHAGENPRVRARASVGRGLPLMAWRKGGRTRKGEKSPTSADSAERLGAAERTAQRRTEQVYRRAHLSASGRAERTDRGAGLWRRLRRPRASSELKERLAGLVAEKAREDRLDAAILEAQGGRCAVCGGTPVTPHRDEEREKVLCHDCYLLIEDARERYETPDLAADRLTAAALYLTTTEGDK
jgi:hypothetical protein